MSISREIFCAYRPFVAPIALGALMILVGCSEPKPPEPLAITLPAPSPSATAPPAMTAGATPTVDFHRMPDSMVTTWATTPDHSLWYAFDKFDDAGGSSPYSENQGLYRQRDGQIMHYDVPGPIRVLEVGPDGRLYVGAGCGVMRFRDEVWETLLEPECGQRTSVRELFPVDMSFAEDGAVWVGGAYSLARYLDGRWTEFEDIPAVRVAVASDGTVWAMGWNGRANSGCCLTHLIGGEQITYTWASDVPAEPEVVDQLRGRP